MSVKIFKRIIVALTLVLVGIFWIFAGKKSEIFHGDTLGYYMYLPSTFIYHNLKTVEETPIADDFPENTKSSFRNLKNNGFVSPIGYKLNQYTYGVALMEAPFFFLAHGYEKLSHKSANGYTSSYINSIKISAIIYAFLGLLFVYRILNEYFDELASLLVTALTLLATNLLWFTFYQAGMSHVPLFFLWSVAIWLSIRLYINPRPALFLMLGFVCGLITLIRPTDILCLLIPLLYQVYNRETFVQRFNFLMANWKNLLLFILFFLLPIVPQMFYWKALAGSYLFYSYGNQSFDWLHPKLIEGLFMASNGWLFYSPIMIFSIMGMFLFKTMKPWLGVLWTLVPLYIYVTYCWYCYNYINGFGSRPMIDIYPLLAIPLAAYLVTLSKRFFVFKLFTTFLCLFFVAANFSYSAQQANGLLFSEESSMRYNWQILFKPHINYNDLVVLDNNEKQPDLCKIRKYKSLVCYPTHDSLSDHYVKTQSGHYAYHMVTEEFLPNSISIVYDTAIFHDATWIKCSGNFMIPYFVDHYRQHQMIFTIDRGEKNIKWEPCKIDTKIGLADSSCGHLNDITIHHVETNKWAPVYYFVRLPKRIQQGDVIKLNIWNIGKIELFVDNLCMDLYR
ncbi:MAG: glycosyltransferase family 39 protein [Bacteroidetes bacterium]|nr:glycosyltransferase family 39 protein [Bacteroidota bacterium]